MNNVLMSIIQQIPLNSTLYLLNKKVCTCFFFYGHHLSKCDDEIFLFGERGPETNYYVTPRILKSSNESMSRNTLQPFVCTAWMHSSVDFVSLKECNSVTRNSHSTWLVTPHHLCPLEAATCVPEASQE